MDLRVKSAMGSNDWVELFAAARRDGSPTVPVALTYRRSWSSSCQPVQVTCDDGHDYIVKGVQVGRSVFNDQIVGRIAFELEMPVARVGLVQVNQELIALNSEMSHITPGLAHGSELVLDCSPGMWFRYCDVAENRPRWGLLAVLYGWMHGAEKQFFYGNNPPHLVYSFDHDAFFPNGPNWSESTLRDARYPDVDHTIVDQAGLIRRELNTACIFLKQLTPEIIANSIACVPDTFGSVAHEERVALAQYLWDRCESMRG